MKNLSMKKNIITALVACLVGYSGVSIAHDAGATLDADGTIESFTGLASVSCFDDGSGAPDSLIVSIRDKSTAVPGLMVSVQVVSSRGNKAISVTDPVSGDADYSTSIALQDGAGPYSIMVNKTGIGARSFDLIYHCFTADSLHTGTDIFVFQFGLPSVTP